MGIFKFIKKSILSINIKKMVKPIIATQTIPIPPEVTVVLGSRTVHVKGSRGELQREYRHFPVDIYLTEEEGKNILTIDVYFAKRELLAAVRTLSTHVSNMITGVTKGFMLKMRMVYAHFPINVAIEKEGKSVEIRNFLGEKRVRSINLLEGVTCERSNTIKDELILKGNDIELVSRSAALISQSCSCKGKDIRKFLDGIYVSDKTTVT